MADAGIIALFVILGVELAGIVGLVTYLLVRQKKNQPDNKLEPDGKVATNYGEPVTEENGRVLLDNGNEKPHSLPGSVESSPELKKKPIEEDIVRVDVEPHYEASPPEVVVEPSAPYDDKPPTVVEMHGTVDEHPIVPLDVVNEEEEPDYKVFPEENSSPEVSKDDTSSESSEPLEVDEPLHEVVVLPPPEDTKIEMSSSSSSSSSSEEEEEESLPDSRTQAETLKLESSDDDRDLSSAKSDHSSPQKETPADESTSSSSSEDEPRHIEAPLILPTLVTEVPVKERKPSSSEDDVEIQPHKTYERPPIVPLTVDDEKIRKPSTTSESESDAEIKSEEPEKQEPVSSSSSSSEEDEKKEIQLPEHRLIEPISVHLDEKDRETSSSSSSDESVEKATTDIPLKLSSPEKETDTIKNVTLKPVISIKRIQRAEVVRHRAISATSSSSSSDEDPTKSSGVSKTLSMTSQTSQTSSDAKSFEINATSTQTRTITSIENVETIQEENIYLKKERKSKRITKVEREVSATSSATEEEIEYVTVKKPKKKKKKKKRRIIMVEQSSSSSSASTEEEIIHVHKKKKEKKAKKIKERTVYVSASSSSSSSDAESEVNIPIVISPTPSEDPHYSTQYHYDVNTREQHHITTTIINRSPSPLPPGDVSRHHVYREILEVKREKPQTLTLLTLSSESDKELTSPTTRETSTYSAILTSHKGSSSSVRSDDSNKARKVSSLEVALSPTTKKTHVYSATLEQPQTVDHEEVFVDVDGADKQSSSSSESEKEEKKLDDVIEEVIAVVEAEEQTHVSDHEESSKISSESTTTTTITTEEILVTTTTQEKQKKSRRDIHFLSAWQRRVTLDDLFKAGVVTEDTINDLEEGKIEMETVEESLSLYLVGKEPIAGLLMSDTGEKMRIFDAWKKGLIRRGTSISLLEAQAATGRIIDPVKVEKMSVADASKKSVIDRQFEAVLVRAERAVYGYKTRLSTHPLSLFEAMKRGLVVENHGIRLLEAQIATGGIVDPKANHRLPVEIAFERGLFDERLHGILEDPSDDTRGFFDPNTEENLTYLELMERCVIDKDSGLRLLPFKINRKKAATKVSKVVFESATKRQVLLEDIVNAELVDQVTAAKYDEGNMTSQEVNEMVGKLRVYVDGTMPIAGVINSITGEKMSIVEACRANLIRKGTAFELLEAQAACGKIIDVQTGKAVSMETAIRTGVIDSEFEDIVSRASRAVTGYREPFKREVLSLLEALARHLVVRKHAVRLLEAQIATGGIVDIKSPVRISVEVAQKRGLVEYGLAEELEKRKTESFFDPVTGENMNYSELMGRCVLDKDSSLLFLMVEGGTVTQNVRPFEPDPDTMNIREKPPTGKITTEVVKTKHKKRKSKKSKKTTTSTSSTTPPSSPPAILSRRVVIVDPETGKELSVTEALKMKFIDEDTARQLLAQEGEWVEEGTEENVEDAK